MEPLPDWAKLSRNDEITLHRDGKEVASGYVDMLALDGSVLWLIQNDGKGRAMFHHTDGLSAFRKRETHHLHPARALIEQLGVPNQPDDTSA